MADAQVKVNQLKVSLQEAFNVNTGKLDLTKFSESLKKSGITLEEYRKSLSTLGPEGQKAFMGLANAISTSEIPLKRTSKLMQDLGITMKNTIKWQLSSSAMHGFMSAVSQAWNYAKDLNESLNNIRIVTGQNTDQMAAFAQQANAAAKALSTTTTKYTDASLIYYQQGLDDKEVQDRTNTTIKLANASRQSVEESADQMTTIWNNYADGSKELEYYADVLVKLGATTASSSKEIAAGISKFAAVGETVGLTYEYATAALATVTATTRQSADTVGTAFKTLFARIQDLELGKTLEDGTDLGTYAEALEKVGIKIKTTSGEVKDMNIILDEMGEKWATLSKDEQIALAQNVAGVRQYTQLMALMNNWDFFKKNVQTASDASGALKEQQEIYAESWEAAGKRVKASLEDVYNSLINDEAVIDATDAIAKIVDGVGTFIDALGGAKGVIIALGAIIMNVFRDQIGGSIDNTIQRIKMLTPSGQKAAEQLKYDTVNSLQKQANEQGNTGQGQALKESYEAQAQIQKKILDNGNKYTEAELERARVLQQEVAQYGSIYAEKKRIVDLSQRNLQNEQDTLKAVQEMAIEEEKSTLDKNSRELDSVNEELKLLGTDNYETYLQLKEDLKKARSEGTMDEDTYQKGLTTLEQMANAMDPQIKKIEELKKRQEELTKAIETSTTKLKEMGEAGNVDALVKNLKDAIKTQEQLADIQNKFANNIFFNEDETDFISEDAKNKLKDYAEQLAAMENLPAEVADKVKLLNEEMQKTNPDVRKVMDYVSSLSVLDTANENAAVAVNNAENAIRNLGKAFNLSDEAIERLIQEIYDLAAAENNASGAADNFRQKNEQAQKTLENFGKVTSTVGKGISAVASTAGNLAMVFNGLKSIINTINDDSASLSDKFVSIAMGVSMLGGSLKSLINNFSSGIGEITTFGTSLAKSASGATAAFGGFISTLGGALVTVVAVAAVVAALGTAIYILYERAKNSDPMYQLEQRTEALGDALTETKNKVEDLKSSFDSIGEQTSALDDLTEGTVEWYTAVNDINTAVMNLIEKYPELAKIVQNNNGILGFDPEEQANTLQEYIDQQNQLQAGVYANNADILQEKNKKSYLDLQAQLETNLETRDSERQAKEGTSTGINDYLESLRLGNTEGATSKALSDVISAWESGAINIDMSAEDIQAALGLAGDAGLAFAETIQQLLPQIQGTIDQANENEAVANTYRQQAVASSLSNTEIYQKSENKDILAAKVSQDWDAQRQALISEYKEQAETTTTGEAAYNDKLVNDFLNLKHISKDSITQDGNEITYNDGENDITVNMDDIISQLATLNTHLEDSELEKANAETQSEIDAGNKVASGFGEQMTRVDVGAAESMDLTGYTREEMDAIHDYINDSNNEISDSVKSAYEAAREENIKARQDTTSRIRETLGKQVSSLTNASTETQEKLVDNYESSFKQAGEKGAQALNQALEGLDDDTLQQVGNALDDIDWSGGDGLTQLKNKLAENGVEIDLTSEAWQNFASIMESTSYESLDQLRNTLKDIKSIVDGLSFGNVISDEDYQKIIDYNSALKSFFVETESGYKYLGDTDLGEVVYGDFLDKSSQAIAAYQGLTSLAGSDLGQTLGGYADRSAQDQVNLFANRNMLGDQSQDALNSAMAANQISSDQVDSAIADIQAAQAENPTVDITQLDAYTQVIGPLIDTLSQAADSESNFNSEIEETIQVAMNSATTIGDLQSAMDAFAEAGNGAIDQAVLEALPQALMSVAANYENTTDEVEDYQAALASGTEEQVAAAQDSLVLATRAGELAKKFDLDADALEQYAKQLKDSGKYANVTGDELAEIAKDQARYDKAIQSCSKNLDTWKKALNNVSKNKMVDPDTMKTLADAYGNMFDIDGSKLSNSFLKSSENLSLFEKAANGSESAYNELQAAVRQDIAVQAGFDDSEFQTGFQNLMNTYHDGQSLDDLEVGANLDTGNFLQGLTDLVNAAGMTAEEATDYLSSMGVDATVKTIEDNETATSTKNDLAPQVVEEDKMPVPVVASDGSVDYHYIPISAVRYKAVPAQYQDDMQNKSFALEVTSAHKSSGGNIKHSQSSASPSPSKGSGGGGGGGGGGSSKPAKKIKKTKFTDLGDRYHTITKQLEDQSRAVEKLSKLEDRLYGASKIKAMERQSKELKKQIELNKQKAEEAKKYLEEDTNELNASVTDFNAQFGTNLTVQLDDEGNITNYREIVEEMQRVSNEWEDYLNSLATQEEQDSEENQEYQEKLDDAISRITDAIDQYEETDQTLEDIEDEMEDLNDQIQQLNFDAWAEKLELVADKFDRYTTLLEHTNKLLGISGDNIYTAAQALTQQVGTPNEDGTFSGGVYGQALDTIKQLVGETAFEAFQSGATNVFDLAKTDANSAVGELYQKYQNGDINQAQYVEGLKQLQDQFYELGDTIVEIDEYAFTAYRNALEDGKERLERYTKVIDQAASQLDHMNNLLDLIGQQTDYEKKGAVLEGQKEVSKANLDAKTSIYDMAKTQWEEVKANWDAMDDKQKEKYKDTYDAALDYYMEASDEWYSAQEDFAEKTKALAENQLALAEKLARESILGEGVSWDAVSDQLDRYSSIGEEYLTKTNQIYEVTKLTRTIQGDIDKTSNTAAKKRLETFKKQTEELAKQEELTEYEMELQNKKYELLLAEIAMEEAQNAKSQVRLTRDSEGNYSYTYTTDEEEMQKAEDEYLQKQNDLYNYLLDGTNDYYTKYVETMREATETFQSINEAYLNGEIETEEEYHRQMLEAQQYYNNLMQTYKNLYNVAMDELGDQAVDSWTTDSGLILDTTVQLNDDVGTEIDGIIGHGARLDQSYNDFAKQYITYITDEEGKLSEFTTFTETEHGKQQGYWNATQTAINEYYQEIDTNIPIASQDIEDLRKEVEKVGNEAKNQARNIDTLTGSISKQLTEVDKVVTAWDQYADAVEKVREALAALQTDINGGIDAEGGNPEWGPGDGTEEPGDGNPTGGIAPPSGEGDMSGSGKYGNYVTVTGHSPNRYFITSSGEKYHLTGTAANGYSGSDPQAVEIQKAWDSYVGKNGYSNSIDWNTNKLDLNVIGLESGGYTGEWDDGSGRLALLHSKELVLNKEDTANLLSSVELIRDLIKVIDLNALATAMNSISALSSNSCAPEQKELEHEKLEQDIHIEANFPNATDKEEILGAFRSLSDLASQYAHRK